MQSPVARVFSRDRSTPVQDPIRHSLSLALDGLTLQVRGRLDSASTLVERLVCQEVAGPGRLVLNQAPGAAFGFDVDLAALRQACGDDARISLSLIVHDPGWTRMGKSSQPADVTRQSWRLGKFATTDNTALGAIDVDGVPAVVSFVGTGSVDVEFGDGRTARARASTSRLSLHRTRSRYEAALRGCSAPLASVDLVVAGRQSQSREVLPAPTVTDVTTRADSGQYSYELSGPIPLDRLGPADAAWDEIYDVFFEVRLQGVDRPIRRYLYSPGPLRKAAVRDVALEGREVSHLVLPYFAAKTHQVALRVENFSPDNLRYLRRVLRFAWLLAPLRPFLGIWLVGELPYKAQDNGFHLFGWIRANHPKRRAYYVIDPASPDFANVEPLGNVLAHGSRQHILRTILASRFLGTHHAEYLFASRARRMRRWSRGIRVSLRHGVLGTKNMTPLYGRRAHDFHTDLFFVSSSMEREMVVDDFGHHASKVKVTGLSRFDALLAKDVEPGRTILVIPTWRDWLAREEDFLRSHYLEQWSAFLQAPAFQSLLADNGLTARFILHPNMRHYAHHFEAAGISVIGQGEADVQQLMKESVLMVTDYSSVGFDFSFLGRPVVYFQFDRDRFIGSLPSHLDLDSQLPGPVAFTADELLDRVLESVTGDFVVPEQYRERSRRFIDHPDRHNNQRVFDQVRSAWKPTIGLARLRDSNLAGSLFLRFRGSRHYLRAMKALYRVARLFPTRNLIVFESNTGKQYGDSPRYLYERLLERSHGARLAWINDTTIRLPDPATDKIVRFSPRYFLTLARARMWITNQNIPHYLEPARGTTYVQTWHGTPLKRMQHDVESDEGRDATYLDRVSQATGYWDHLLSPSSFATKAFRSAFRYDGNVIEQGYPRNDLFHRSGSEEIVGLVRSRLHLQDDRQILLYAPTFRDGQTKGAASIDDLELPVRELRERFGDSFVLVLRFHPLIKGTIRIPDELGDFVIDATRYPDAQELLIATDVLITDYSSMMFDFSSTARPMLFFAPDLEHYRDSLRGFYLDFEAEAPGPIVRTDEELIAALSQLESISRKYAARVASFASTYAPQDDGNAADRVLNELFGLPKD